jgi:hypothetical protein
MCQEDEHRKTFAARSGKPYVTHDDGQIAAYRCETMVIAPIEDPQGIRAADAGGNRGGDANSGGGPGLLQGRPDQEV